MPESMLSRDLTSERAQAIRFLLAHPLLDGSTHREEFRLIVGCRTWLRDWFDSTCGWQLTVDVNGGFARLFKRSDRPDESRPARRNRGARAAFDRRRYELLCLVCAELSAHPVTTIGLLASGVASSTTTYMTQRFDSTLQRERAAFVDALKLLADWGVTSFSAGDVDAFIGSERANAIVTASTSRLHHLLSSATSPSSMSPDTTAAAVRGLTSEPRYGDAPDESNEVDAEQRLRWIRHSLGRSLLDDPVTYIDEISEGQRSYIANPTGRRWVRDRVTAAGFELEERLEGLMAIDVEARATDATFPGPGSNVNQAALLLIDHFVIADSDGHRLVSRTVGELTAAVRDLLTEHSGWARQFRDHEGPSRLAAEAVEVLASFGLARRSGDVVHPRPAIARYASDQSVIGPDDAAPQQQLAVTTEVVQA